MVTTRVTRHIRAPRASVYRALLDPEMVQQWMVPDHMTSRVHVFEPHEGGAFHITLTYDEPTTSGKTSAQSDSFRGRFTKLVADTEMVQVIEFDTEDPTLAGEMTITYRLGEEEGGTHLVGIHENLPPGLSPAANELGWRMSIDKLAGLVEGEDS
ncbi:MAG: SRPBCC family protein [Acidimicrobiia bacterium]